jgi:hypothetical protein
VVLARYPEPGRVKTRLATALGAEAACALHRAFVRDLARRLRELGVPVWWAFTPRSTPFARLVGTRRCFPQRGADLGMRIHHALARVHRARGDAVLALGADAPHVSRRELARAMRALAGGTELVLGPAADGGYYLIGVRVPRRRVFERIAWGTARVAEATRRRAHGLGLSRLEVAPGFDVDRVADLAALARVVRRRPREFPHTRAALARLGFTDSRRRAGSLRPAAFPSSGCDRR